jgi:hypothetical protein
MKRGNWPGPRAVGHSTCHASRPTLALDQICGVPLALLRTMSPAFPKPTAAAISEPSRLASALACGSARPRVPRPVKIAPCDLSMPHKNCRCLWLERAIRDRANSVSRLHPDANRVDLDHTPQNRWNDGCDKTLAHGLQIAE